MKEIREYLNTFIKVLNSNSRNKTTSYGPLIRLKILIEHQEDVVSSHSECFLIDKAV